MLGIITVCLAAVALLGVIWFKERSAMRSHLAPTETLDRGLIGEATSAFEDVGRQFMKDANHSDSDRVTKVDPWR
jgi:hypothetical protein